MLSIEDTLIELDNLYYEQSGKVERTNLLCKSAFLELCGWLETYFDEILLKIANKCNIDDRWVRQNVIKDNYGFAYNKNLRKMIVKLIGEVGIRQVEASFNLKAPGILDRIIKLLNDLISERNVFAHTNLASLSIQKQLSLNSPSWALNQQRLLAKLLLQFENELLATI